MIKNYLKIALRNIKRYAGHSILNISGMAIGMACAILLLLMIQFEVSYDKFRKNADNVYRVIEKHYSEGKSEHSATTPGLMASALKAEYPEIIRSSRFFTTWNNFPKGDEIIPGRISLVDKDFLRCLKLNLFMEMRKPL
ncbi:MAG: ABC transporter permease [Bacteroidales bacterium]|nr:ABC transporter permease [Bacteroidales bacterium]